MDQLNGLVDSRMVVPFLPIYKHSCIPYSYYFLFCLLFDNRNEVFTNNFHSISFILSNNLLNFVVTISMYQPIDQCFGFVTHFIRSYFFMIFVIYIWPDVHDSVWCRFDIGINYLCLRWFINHSSKSMIVDFWPLMVYLWMTMVFDFFF